MELIYGWIEKYRNLNKLGINFNPDYDIHFKEDHQELVIIKKDKKLNLFPSHIKNIITVVGKNGTGKTNILDILGMGYKDRQRECINKDYSYFLVYHLREDYYVIEGIGLSLVENIIDIPEGTNALYSMVVLLQSNKLIYQSFFGTYDESYLEIAYLNYRSKFRNGYDEFPFKEETENTLFFHRSNIRQQNLKLIHRCNLINELNESQREFKNIFISKKPIFLVITYSNDVYSEENIELKTEKKTNFRLHLEKKTKSELKKGFIKELIEDYIHNIFEHLIGLNNRKELTEKEKINYRVKIENSVKKKEIIKGDEISYLLKVYRCLVDELVKFNESPSEIKYYFALSEFVGIVVNLNELYFERKKISIPFMDSYDDITLICNLIDKYKEQEINYLNNGIEVNIEPTSSGEDEIISLLSSIYQGLHPYYMKNKKHVMILLDEPNNLMHPEWSRRLIQLLINFLDNLVGDQKYTLIISTHSPFLLSDIPRENVIALEMDKNSQSVYIKRTELEKTFASNIHTLFSDSFFMETTIGEFAKEIINQLINQLNTKDQLNNSEKKEILAKIDIIGEPLIAERLMEMYKKLDVEEQKESIKNNIKKLEDELRWLDSNDKNL